MNLLTINDFLQKMEMNGYSPNTLRAYRTDLLNALTWEKVNSLSQQEVEMGLALGLRMGLKAGWAVRTHNRKLACFKSYGKFIGWPELLSDYKRPATPPGIAHPLPEGVAGVLDMIAAARKPEHKAMITLCGLCGLRISEALQVRPAHVSTQGNRVLLTIRGKGNKTRVVPLSDRVCVELLPRLAACSATNERLVPITDRKAREAVTRIGLKALGRGDIASHDMRMTFGTVAYAQSKNLRAVQELLGHASVNTTENYTFINLDTIAKVGEIA